MAKVLNETARRRYERQGYFFPLDVLREDEAAAVRGKLESFEAARGHPVSGAERGKSHLIFTWVDELIRHPRILDAVEDLIGPDILCWSTVWWIKEAVSDAYVSWHQDVRYWGLDTSDLVTVWLALSPATPESGCMRILPGSHKGDVLPHVDEYEEDNMLTRGQKISVPIDESKTVAIELGPGQASLHNIRLAHASAPNRSGDRRIGISMHYIPTCTKQLAADWDSASLVRGEDRFHHFAPAPRPARDLDPEAIRFHAKASGAFRDILFKGAARVRQTL
jgi:non-haem Fe2+, alpha-ketoglutarate-dependent halogenase